MTVGFGTLKADVAAWLNRDDLTDQIPTFVRLAEAGFNRALRVTAMMQTKATTATGTGIALPVGWLESRDITLDNEPAKYVSPAEAARLRNDSLATGELFFTLIDDTLEIVPTPSSGTVILSYYEQIPALSDTEPTNWLLTSNYDAYLYGTLVHSAPFLLEDERVPLWKTALDTILGEIQAADNRARRSGATAQSRRRPGYG